LDVHCSDRILKPSQAKAVNCGLTLAWPALGAAALMCDPHVSGWRNQSGIAGVRGSQS
jgi:hypothetical protein